MNTLFGANWRTTLSGWIAILASAIAVNPKLVEFLPESIRSTITGVAGLIAVVSGGTFAYSAKDKQVTGGSVSNDKPDSGTPPAAGSTPLMVTAALFSLLTLPACSWLLAHKPQVDATIAVVEQRALNVAQKVLLALAENEADKGFKADFLDSVALGLRQNETTIVSSDDVEAIARIWSPNDGAQWQTLAGQLGSITSDALQAAGKLKSATIVEQLASGLNNAAASARTSAK
jgi:hypothetical protein